ncbi:hypothetical protein CO165_02795 [Candidatus Roizmanbacteria bacterium CG_4_9_14_3_um_filter_33_18]|uniref:Glycosyltransferase 2-like domain-containing protein n=1 Tax=Candidatus Roizmanbacteria bacterium CG_4_9_14_3_um_filter_33_18 TaxID=1974841 RepID=A0A2M7XY74_9BACT|nr:MAG: hypothetical protein CO165_02795 [Candidatus Roizmanbacteria bacterium CG_4_9_14_3_um_filter_33_18]
MKISVIIPTKNRADSLRVTLDHLLRQLKKNDEVIIIDNKSTDHTKIVVDTFRKKKLLPTIIYKVENLSGPSYARNLGIKSSSNDILAFLDDDCIVSSKWVTNIKNFYLLKKKHSKIILQGKITHISKENDIFYQILILKNKYSLEVLKKKQIDNYVNYINAGNFSCTRLVVNKYSKFFDEKNFPFICEERELSQRLNLDGFLIKFFKKMPVIHQKQQKTLLNSLVTGYKYGLYTGKIIKKFKSKNKVQVLFKSEIKERFQRNIFKEIMYITFRIKTNYFKKVIIFIYLIIREIIYQIALFFGKNSRLC